MTSTTAPPSTATASILDHEKDPAASGLSTQRNSFLDVPKKEEDASSTDIETGTAQAQSPEPEGDYPGGFQLTMIVVALVLSIFLASLDMVSSPWSSPPSGLVQRANVFLLDHCRDGNPQDHR